MNRKCLIFALVFGVALLAPSTFCQFWYGVEGPVPLKIDSSKVTIKFDDGFSYNQVLQPIGRIVEVVQDDHLIDDFLACSLSTGADYDAFLDSLDIVTGIYLAEPYYLSENDFPMLVGEGFCAAFEENVSQQEVDSINTVYKVVIDREMIGMLNVFVIRNTDSSGYRIVELANIYHNLSQTRYAHPDFSAAIEKHEYKLYDYYHEYQLHTKKVIGSFNEVSVWDFARVDSSITVAVVDQGVAPHEDLPEERLVAGWDFGTESA